MNKNFPVATALVLLSIMLGATPAPVKASPNIVYIELHQAYAYFMVDGVGYLFWEGVVTASPYGTGNMVIVFKSVSTSEYNFSVYVAPENLLLGEKCGWLTSLIGNGIVVPEIYTFEGAHSASITIEETATNRTATVSGPISLSITYTPYGDSSTFIEDPGDSPYLDDHDGDGFWSYSTRRACNANGSFNGYELGPTNFNWGYFNVIDYEWYDLGILPTYDVNKDGIINIFDLRICARAYGSKPGDANWNPFVDLNQDGIIDIFDLYKIAKHYLEHV